MYIDRTVTCENITQKTQIERLRDDTLEVLTILHKKNTRQTDRVVKD